MLFKASFLVFAVLSINLHCASPAVHNASPVLHYSSPVLNNAIPPLLDLQSLQIEFPLNLDSLEKIGKTLIEIIKEYRRDPPVDFDESKATQSSAARDAMDSPTIEVPGLGIARGRTLTSLFGRDFFAFHSIPYATPPLDELRFKMPLSWEGEWPKEINDTFYDASYLRAKCPQSSLIVSNPSGREDCLHISIYTPNTISNSDNPKYPVMFFIHGGSFISGDASLYIPTKLMDRDVVVVVVQYRLGSLGFLASGTPDNPGNMGLMDQVMALRWVQEYISYFGGDPSLVTVFGQSAGSASTSWMQFTPRTKAENNNGTPLLNNIIAQSGSALEVWTLDETRESSFQLQAETVGCNDTDVYVTLSCMRELPLDVVVKGYLKVYMDDRKNGGLGFIGNCPVVQEDLAYNFPDEVANDTDLIVIPKHPLRIIQDDELLKINVIAGSVRDEGSLVTGLAYDDYLEPNNKTENEIFLELESIPFFVDAFGIFDKTGAVSNSMKIAFFQNAVMGDWTTMSGGFVDMTGMLFLKSGAWTLTQLLTEVNPDNQVYFYSFEFDSDDSMFPWYFITSPNIPVEGGITHADDLLYLFYLPSLMDERQQLAISRLTKLWSNFAKYGNPTPPSVENENEKWEGDVEKWTPYELLELNFMLMEDEFTMDKDFTTRWNYNSKPVNQLEEQSTNPDVESKESINQSSDDGCNRIAAENNGLKSVTIVLGVSCTILICFSAYILLFTKRS